MSYPLFHERGTTASLVKFTSKLTDNGLKYALTFQHTEQGETPIFLKLWDKALPKLAGLSDIPKNVPISNVVCKNLELDVTFEFDCEEYKTLDNGTFKLKSVAYSRKWAKGCENHTYRLEIEGEMDMGPAEMLRHALKRKVETDSGRKIIEPVEFILKIADPAETPERTETKTENTETDEVYWE